MPGQSKALPEIDNFGQEDRILDEQKLEFKNQGEKLRGLRQHMITEFHFEIEINGDNCFGVQSTKL